MDPTAIVERYLALIADHDSDPAAIRDRLDDGMRFVEHPNLFSPAGSDRGVPRASWSRWRRGAAC